MSSAAARLSKRSHSAKQKRALRLAQQRRTRPAFASPCPAFGRVHLPPPLTRRLAHRPAEQGRSRREPRAAATPKSRCEHAQACSAPEERRLRSRTPRTNRCTTPNRFRGSPRTPHRFRGSRRSPCRRGTASHWQPAHVPGPPSRQETCRRGPGPLPQVCRLVAIHLVQFRGGARQAGPLSRSRQLSWK